MAGRHKWPVYKTYAQIHLSANASCVHGRCKILFNTIVHGCILKHDRVDDTTVCTRKSRRLLDFRPHGQHDTINDRCVQLLHACLPWRGLFWSHWWACAKGWTDRDTIWGQILVSPRNQVLRRHLANTIEWSVICCYRYCSNPFPVNTDNPGRSRLVRPAVFQNGLNGSNRRSQLHSSHLISSHLNSTELNWTVLNAA